MKVISLQEPYATLISKGLKKIETRSWKTNYRGELYIHASSSLFKDGNLEEVFKYISKDELNYGYIICKCNLIDCIYMDKEFIESVNSKEKSFGVYSIGRYAWILDDIELLDKPIKAKGKLNIWEYKE